MYYTIAVAGAKMGKKTEYEMQLFSVTKGNCIHYYLLVLILLLTFGVNKHIPISHYLIDLSTMD